jgi:hypothetical protein
MSCLWVKRVCGSSPRLALGAFWRERRGARRPHLPHCDFSTAAYGPEIGLRSERGRWLDGRHMYWLALDKMA